MSFLKLFAVNVVFCMMCMFSCLVSGCVEDGERSLLNELEGRWEGLGETEGTRYDIHEDGQYDFLRISHGEWKRSYSGKLWIEFEYIRGLYRAILHMSMPDNEDYAVGYHIVDEIIYFEEPSDTEPSMRYQRISGENL